MKVYSWQLTMRRDDFASQRADSHVVQKFTRGCPLVDGGQVLAIRVERAEAFVGRTWPPGVACWTASASPSLRLSRRGQGCSTRSCARFGSWSGHLEGAHVELLVIEALTVEWPFGVVHGLLVLIFRLWLVAGSSPKSVPWPSLDTKRTSELQSFL